MRKLVFHLTIFTNCFVSIGWSCFSGTIAIDVFFILYILFHSGDDLQSNAERTASKRLSSVPNAVGGKKKGCC